MRPESTPERTSALLERIAREDGSPDISLGELLDRFDGRAFGVLVVIATLPAFLPTPVGAGAIAGPLVVLLGLQMAWGLQHPWLPQWLRRRSFARARIGALPRPARRRHGADRAPVPAARAAGCSTAPDGA